MSNEIRVLVIDDEQTIRNLLRSSIGANGYKIAEAKDAKGGIELTASFHPHLVILDLGLPDMHGLELLKELRRWTKVPVIVLTATDDERMKVTLLDSGADDYLTKPFGVQELMARIRVAIRTHGMIEATPVFQSGNLSIDLNQQQVKVNGSDVKLTITEFEVLKILAREHGKVVSQAQLLRQVWGATAVDQGHYVRIYINQLRKKLELDPANPRHIVTEPGVGYRLI